MIMGSLLHWTVVLMRMFFTNYSHSHSTYKEFIDITIDPEKEGLYDFLILIIILRLNQPAEFWIGYGNVSENLVRLVQDTSTSSSVPIISLDHKAKNCKL